MRHKKLKFAIAAVVSFLLGFLSTVRSAPAQQPERFDMKVREDFFAGFGGDQEPLARGMKACEAVLAENPKHGQALVWHGGGLMFQAGQAFQAGDQPKGIGLWTRGLEEMQTGVNLEPENIATRIPRGAILLTTSRFLSNPEMARPLIKDGLGDYELAYQKQKDKFATLGTHPRGELLFGLAEGYSRLGDEEKARAYFEQIRKDLPDTVYAKRANLWIETKTLPANQTGCVGCHVATMQRCIIPLLLCGLAFAQNVSSPAGDWTSNLKFFDNDNYFRLRFESSGTKLTGKLGDNAFDGTFQNGRIEGTVKLNPQTTVKLAGTLQGDRIEGTASLLEQKFDFKWEAMREPPKSKAAPRTHTFGPLSFIISFPTPLSRRFISTPATR